MSGISSIGTGGFETIDRISVTEEQSHVAIPLPPEFKQHRLLLHRFTPTSSARFQVQFSLNGTTFDGVLQNYSYSVDGASDSEVGSYFLMGATETHGGSQSLGATGQIDIFHAASNSVKTAIQFVGSRTDTATKHKWTQSAGQRNDTYPVLAARLFFHDRSVLGADITVQGIR